MSAYAVGGDNHCVRDLANVGPGMQPGNTRLLTGSTWIGELYARCDYNIHGSAHGHDFCAMACDEAD
jgi:hypothetical protein